MKKCFTCIFRCSWLLVFFFVRTYKLIKYGTFRIFDLVSIETMTTCNRKCKFCPNAYYERKKAVMSNKLFHRIINQLASINFCGRISLHFYNEPLLDKRLVNFIREVRHKCLNSFIMIDTNGDFLDLKLFDEMVDAGLDLLLVLQYDKVINKNIEYLLNSLDSEKKRHIRVEIFNDSNILNRAGLIPFLKINKPLQAKCSLPAKQMIISAGGKVLLCCNDYLEKEVIGDCNQEDIVDIWFNEKFRRIRKHLRSGDRIHLKICKYCDWKENFEWRVHESISCYHNIPPVKFARKIKHLFCK